MKRSIQSVTVLAASVALLYVGQFTLFRWVLNAGMTMLGNPQYVGFAGIVLPHLLLYTTPLALACLMAWWIFARLDWISLEFLRTSDRRSMKWGMAGGLAALAFTVVFIGIVAPASIGYVEPNVWKIAGNIFSNLAEEIVFRGFFLVALTAVLGFWPAALLSSLAWGFTHYQYPLEFQLLIAGVGVGWSYVVQKTKSIWSAYVAHEVLDILADRLIS